MTRQTHKMHIYVTCTGRCTCQELLSVLGKLLLKQDRRDLPQGVEGADRPIIHRSHPISLPPSSAPSCVCMCVHCQSTTQIQHKIHDHTHYNQGWRNMYMSTTIADSSATISTASVYMVHTYIVHVATQACFFKECRYGETST